MDFFINANSCEEADRKMQEVIHKLWSKGIMEFVKRTTEEGKKQVVDYLMERGYIPLYLNGKSKKEIYYQLTTEEQKVRKVSVHQTNIFSQTNSSRQKN